MNCYWSLFNAVMELNWGTHWINLIMITLRKNNPSSCNQSWARVTSCGILRNRFSLFFLFGFFLKLGPQLYLALPLIYCLSIGLLLYFWNIIRCSRSVDYVSVPPRIHFHVWMLLLEYVRCSQQFRHVKANLCRSTSQAEPHERLVKGTGTRTVQRLSIECRQFTLVFWAVAWSGSSRPISGRPVEAKGRCQQAIQ